MQLDIPALVEKAHQIRRRTLEVCVRAGTGHVTSSMSCLDILVTLFYGGVLRYDPKDPGWEDRDRFIASKGQASPVLYTILADLGFFPEKNLDSFAQKGGKFGVHLQGDVPGAEVTVGSLGQGFGLATGLALAAKMDRRLHMVFSLLGDGECYEGSIWETAMFASHHRLNNLVAVVDRNFMCVTDFTENIVALEPIDDKWRSFGWDVARVDGHDHGALLEALRGVRSRRSARPLLIVADTVKGKGIERLSNVPLWHGLAPKGEEARLCMEDLERGHHHG